MSSLRAVFIVGPTASGKSELALSVAQPRQLPLVNCDSLQIYQRLEIGSAMPTREDFAVTPHYLYDTMAAGTTLTAAGYVAQVARLLEGPLARRDLIFCGGSGFYIQALEKGMYDLPELTPQIKEEVERIIAQKGWGDLHRWLLEKDPQLARTVHPNDQYRIRRALEIRLLSQQTSAQMQRQLTPSPLASYRIEKVALWAEKEVMRARVRQRTERMLELGFIEEVQGLLHEGFRDWKPLQSVGYAQVVAFLEGKMSHAELLPAIELATVQLIKKQLTWFRKDAAIRWFNLSQIDAAKDYLRERLALD